MRVVVVGGAGFVGGSLIEHLLQSRPEIEILSLDNYNSGSLGNHADCPRVRYIAGNSWDILSIPAFQEFEPDVVFHFGEFSRIAESFENPSLVFRSNTYGTQQVFEYCARTGAKLVYSGSSAILGNNGQDQHLSPYAWTKAKNIELARNYGSWYGMRYVIAYFFNVFGPRQVSDGPYATVIGIFERQRAQGEPLTVVSPGTQTRAFTHIDDIVEGLVLVAEQGEGDGYLLGSEEQLSILEVAELFGGPHVIVPERRGERGKSEIQPSRARTELGWETRRTLHEYIEHL